jgi:hypothetical protein
MLEGTAQPTEELQRRHEVEAPLIDAAVRRPHWLVYLRFEQLLDQGKIDDTTYAAGCGWRSDYELVATLTMPTPALDRVPGGGSGSWCPPSLVLDAQGRLREVRAIVGEWERLLIDVLVEDRSWRSLAKLYARKETTLKDNLVALVTALEPVYANYRQPG